METSKKNSSFKRYKKLLLYWGKLQKAEKICQNFLSKNFAEIRIKRLFSES